MKKLIIIPAIFLIVILAFVFSSCAYGQTDTTMSTAIESSTVETTLLELPDTSASAKEKTAQNFELLYVPKLDGLPWFDVVGDGLKKCADDYGFSLTVIGPPKSDPAIQAQIVLDNISKGFDAMVVCPLDDEMIDSAFARANKVDIMTFSNEGYTLKNVTFDIEAMSNKSFGESIMAAGIDYTGGTGRYIVGVGFPEAVAYNEWADYEISYQEENAPGLENILGYSTGSDRFEDNEDDSVAYEKLEEFLKEGKDFDLIVGNTFSTGLAAGEFISKKRLKGEVSFVGTGMPVTIGKYIEDEVLQEGFFWDPYLIGYATGYISLKSWLEEGPLEGSPVTEPNGNIVEGYESLGITVNRNGGNTIFGDAICSITKDNIGKWYQRFEGYSWPQL